MHPLQNPYTIHSHTITKSQLLLEYENISCGELITKARTISMKICDVMEFIKMSANSTYECHSPKGT